MPPVGHRDPTGRRFPLVGGLADHFADLGRGRRVDELARHRRNQLVDPGMLGQPLLVELPVIAEAPVPQVEAPVAGKDADRFVEVVEGRRADAEQGVARRREAQLLRAVLEDQPQPAVRKRLGDDPQMVAAREHPFFLDHLVGTCEPGAPLVLPHREVACFGKPLLVAHAVDHAVELGLFRQPVRVELGHHRERPVEEAEVAVGVELRRARGHPVGELALRFDVTRELGTRVLQVLDVDREAGDRAARQGHVDDPQHPPLAADDGRLHARDDAPAVLRGTRRRQRAVVARFVDQLRAAADHVRRVAALDRAHKRAVHQAELEVGPAVPHRERRGLNQVGQGIERPFGLAEAECDACPVLLARARIEEPQEERPRGLGGRSGTATHREHARRAARMNLAGHARRRIARGFDVLLEGVEILGGDPAVVADEVRERLRRGMEPEVADQLRIDFDRAVGTY